MDNLGLERNLLLRCTPGTDFIVCYLVAQWFIERRNFLTLSLCMECNVSVYLYGTTRVVTHYSHILRLRVTNGLHVRLSELIKMGYTTTVFVDDCFCREKAFEC